MEPMTEHMYDAAYYAAFLNLKGKTCVVVGGGRVASRKVQAFLDHDCLIRVISPMIVQGIREMAETSQRVAEVELLERDYRPGDLEGAFLVVAATDCEEVNRRVFLDADAQNIPVNVVDDPEKCTFIVPALVRRGGLSIAISTAGKSPFLARRIRESLEEEFGDEYACFLQWLGEARPQVIAAVPVSGRKKAFSELASCSALKLLGEGKRDEAWSAFQQVLQRVLGSSGHASRL